MGDYTVIADVGETICHVLRKYMTPEPIPQPELIGLASPAEKGDLRLSLFLYNVRESGEYRRTEMIRKGSILQHPPMSLELFYLLTAHSTAELTSRAKEESRILGKALQVLYDHSILRGSELQGTLAENNEEIKIRMDNLPIDVLTKLWNFPNVPFKLSQSYSVGPIFIDSMRTKQTSRVTDVEFNVKG